MYLVRYNTIVVREEKMGPEPWRTGDGKTGRDPRGLRAWRDPCPGNHRD